MPRFSEDDVLDFVVTEAVVMKYNTWEANKAEEQRKQQERRAWRKQAPGSGKAGTPGRS